MEVFRRVEVTLVNAQVISEPVHDFLHDKELGVRSWPAIICGRRVDLMTFGACKLAILPKLKIRIVLSIFSFVSIYWESV
jgi:hypothetical protein